MIVATGSGVGCCFVVVVMMMLLAVITDAVIGSDIVGGNPVIQ